MHRQPRRLHCKEQSLLGPSSAIQRNLWLKELRGPWGVTEKRPFTHPPRQLPWPSSGVITQAELGTEVDTSSAK